MIAQQDCRQCGKCCEKWGWGQEGIKDDIIPWIRDNRQDILRHVRITLAGGRQCNGTAVSEHDLPAVIRIHYWAEPDGRVLTRCPFFQRADDGKVWCRIHTAKPKVCTGFTPWNEGIRDYALSCPACRSSDP